MLSAKSATMPVSGMTCVNCALRIESNLRGLAGIKNATVDFAGEQLTVSFDPETLNENDIITQVKRIGYTVATGKIDLPITGLQDQDRLGWAMPRWL